MRVKRDRDKKGRFELTFAPGGYIFLEPPPLITTAVERLVSKSYSQLRRWWPRPYRIVSVGPKFFKIEHVGITTILSINRTTHTTPLHGLATNNLVQRGENVQATYHELLSPEDAERAREYVDNCIVRHMDSPDGLHCVIRLYEYGDKDDTIEPADNTP